MNLQDILLPYQRAFVNNPSKRKIWLSSRQAGKSFSLAYIAVYKALLTPKGLSLCISTGARAADELLKKCVQFAEAAKVLCDGALSYQASQSEIRFNTGARILSLPSGNPSGLRGYTSACTIIDECAFIEHPYDVLQAIAPTLTRDPNAELIIASTPAGCQGLFYDLWNRADEEPGWYKQTTTIDDAIADGLKVDIAQLQELCPDPDIFDMEYRCRFSKEVGAFIDPAVVVFADKCPFTGGRRILGVDFGRKNDATALVELVDNGKQVWLDNIIVLKSTDWQTQFSTIEVLNQKHPYAGGNMDANGIGSAIAEQVQKRLNQRLAPFTTTATNKTPMYEHTKGLIYDKKLVVNSAFKDMILADFKNVNRVVGETGKVTYSAGHAASHSDITSALCLGLQFVKEHPLTFAKPQSYMPHSVFR